MRFLMKVSIPVDAGNQAVKSGTLSRTIESILADLKPENAYFLDDNGKRTGFLFFDMKDSSQIPAVAEPWFLSLNATVEIHPAMNIEDLKRAAPYLEEAGRKYAASLSAGAR
jgi:hypothetical protein